MAARVRYAPQDTAAVFALLRKFGPTVTPLRDDGRLLEAAFEASVDDLAHLDEALRSATAGRVVVLVP